VRRSLRAQSAVLTEAPTTVGTQLTALRDKAQSAAGDAAETLAPRIDAAREALAPRIEQASERLADAAGRAGEWAAPRIEAAREQAKTTVREQVAPRVAKTLATAVSASGPARDEAQKRGEAALQALRGELPPQKRRWPRALFLLTAGAAAGAAAGLITRRREPAYPQVDAYPPVSSTDPYARAPGAAEPAAPVVAPAHGADTGATATTADATIDVTEPVATEAAAPRRRRTPKADGTAAS